MVRYEFGLPDLARLRFAISPMWELVISLRALRDPSEAAMHLPWVRSRPGARARPRSVAVARPRATERLHPRLPHAAPRHSPGELRGRTRRDPLDADRARRREVGLRVRDGLSPELADPFLRRPRRSVERLADSLAAYWEAALEPHWPRVRSLLEADLMYRSRRLTEGGPTALFADLHPAIHWRNDGLEIEMAYSTTWRWTGGGCCSCPPSSRRDPSPSPRPTGNRR